MGRVRRYLYLPWNAVPHKLPDTVTDELAGIATPLSNGIQWALRGWLGRLSRASL